MSNLDDLKDGALTEVELNNKNVRQLRQLVKDYRIAKDTPITNMSKTQILDVIKSSEWWRKNRPNQVEPEAQDIQPIQPETQIIRTNTIQIDEEEGIKPASILNIDGKYIIKLFTQKKKTESPAQQLEEIQEQLNEIAENEDIPTEIQENIITTVENQIKEILKEQETKQEEDEENPQEVVNIKTKTNKAKMLLKELSKLIKEIEEL